ncbi:hypothetical protein EZV62_020245 [Acer yangbiense]|uniref:HMA domain-containing protein n=1 Tax=Acer yangbiense TaxID=1000413 RepID=A0A5C7HDQ8_9ROSI|nr:hypothetical protein EZV62_020245 [Acer yangbiense]
MSKDAELKKIELKVTVNCCDGCKKKVKKALRGIEGVLKTEIDPLQPKVTVLGSVDPKILIKRLLKVGKQAEFWSSGNQNAGKEKKEVVVDTPAKNEMEKSKPECEQAKPSDSCVKTTDKIKESNNGSGGEEKASKNDQKAKDDKDEKVKESPVNSYIPEVIKTDNPIPLNPQVPEMNFGMYPNTTVGGAGNVRTQAQAQYCYMVEPYPINVPYYAIPPYPAHPLPHPTCCGQGYFCHDRPVYQPQYQAPTTQVGDYFSDENTVGCSVM